MLLGDLAGHATARSLSHLTRVEDVATWVANRMGGGVAWPLYQQMRDTLQRLGCNVPEFEEFRGDLVRNMTRTVESFYRNSPWLGKIPSNWLKDLFKAMPILRVDVTALADVNGKPVRCSNPMNIGLGFASKNT